MRLYFILLLFVSFNSFSQTPPVLTAQGVAPIVTEVKNMS